MGRASLQEPHTEHHTASAVPTHREVEPQRTLPIDMPTALGLPPTPARTRTGGRILIVLGQPDPTELTLT
jgi:hypothetical protein